MRFRIFGKWWNFERVPGNRLTKGNHADTDPPDTKNKTIRIWRGLSGEQELDYTIHEALHAADWWKDEKWIETVAEDLARMLWRLGYRRVEP